MIENKFTENLNSLFGTSPAGYFAGLLRVAVNGAFIIASLFFFFNFISGGIAYINSSGDKGSLESARKKVLFSVVGIFIVFSTYAIMRFVAAVFEIELLQFDLSILKVGL